MIDGVARKEITPPQNDAEASREDLKHTLAAIDKTVIFNPPRSQLPSTNRAMQLSHDETQVLARPITQFSQTPPGDVDPASSRGMTTFSGYCVATSIVLVCAEPGND
jgi:hypothetical protein